MRDRFKSFLVLAFIVAVFVGCLAVPAGAGYISTNFSDGAGTNGSMGTGKWDNNYSLSMGLNTLEAVDQVGLSYWPMNKTSARVFINVSVKDGSFATETMNASQSASFTANGHEYRTYQGMGWYQSGGKGLIDTDPMAYGNGSISFYAWDVLRTDGNFSIGHSWSTDQYGNVYNYQDIYQGYWDISFGSQYAFSQFTSSLDAMGVVAAAPVPEPASAALLGIPAAFALFRRPRR